MAGTGNGAPARRRQRAARRGPGRRVPGRPQRHGQARSSGISFDVLPGRDARHRRRIGLRQDRPPVAPIMQIPTPTSGSVVFEGRDLTRSQFERAARGAHQDPDDLPGSDLVAEPAPHGPRQRPGTARHLGTRHRAERETLVDDILESVGIDPQRAAESRPHQFSGGQCQRISIARALVLDPTLIICDEPVSALDVSVQAQVLNLLEDLKAKYGLTLMFIAHDLAVVKNVSDRVAVMYLGKLCEVAPSDDLYARAAHPYTNVLLESIPEPDPVRGPFGGRPGRRAAVTGQPAVAVVASTLAARTPTRCANRRSRSCGRWARAISWRVTTRSRPPSRSAHRPPTPDQAFRNTGGRFSRNAIIASR